MDIILIILIGGLAGWIASKIYRGSGYGIFGSIVIGILGSFLGFWLFDELDFHISDGIIGTLIAGIVGALLILVILNLIRRSR